METKLNPWPNGLEKFSLCWRFYKIQKKKPEPCGAYRVAESEDFAFVKTLLRLHFQTGNAFFT